MSEPPEERSFTWMIRVLSVIAAFCWLALFGGLIFLVWKIATG